MRRISLAAFVLGLSAAAALAAADSGTAPVQNGTGAAPQTRILPVGHRNYPMSPQALRHRLKTMGVSKITGVQRNGNVYRVQAVWFGVPETLTINARNGDVLAPKHLTAQQIETKLKGLGWSHVRDVKLQGRTFSARAKRKNVDYKLTLSASSGMILGAKHGSGQAGTF